MTKPSNPKRKRKTMWTIITLKKSTARGNIFPDPQIKSITRPDGTLKQLNFGPFKLWSGFKKIKDYK